MILYALSALLQNSDPSYRFTLQEIYDQIEKLFHVDKAAVAFSSRPAFFRLADKGLIRFRKDKNKNACFSAKPDKINRIITMIDKDEAYQHLLVGIVAAYKPPISANLDPKRLGPTPTLSDLGELDASANSVERRIDNSQIGLD